MGWGSLAVVLTWLVVGLAATFASAALVVLGRKGWSRGLGAILVFLGLVATAAWLRVLAGPQQSWSHLLLLCVLFSLALNAVAVALSRFRQRDIHWRTLCLPPAAILLLGNLPLFGVAHDVALLHAIAAVFVAQGAWVAVSLWHMRHLQLGLGYRMLCAADAIFLLGLPIFQCGLGLGLSLGASEPQWTWYGIRAMLMLSAILLLSLGFMRMVQDRREARSRHAALRDPLTRMLNRRALVRALEHCMKNAIRQAQPMAILLVDVDHFKRVNDTFGHIAGDKVLRHVSRVLASHVRADAFVGRFGGEEFVVVCPDTALDDAEILATRLNLAVRTSSVNIKEQPLEVTVSIGGYAGAIPGGAAWESLLEVADTAMYRAKDAGRDCVIMVRELPQEHSHGQPSQWQPSHA